MSGNGRYLWIVIPLVVYLFSYQPWLWGKDNPLVFGWIPAFIFWTLICQLIMSAVVVWFTKHRWPDPPEGWDA